MSSHSDKATRLEQWLRERGGYLHPAIKIAHDESHGYHWYCTEPIARGAPLTRVPHTVTLSYLNAIVDDTVTVFKTARGRLPVENIGFFYLMWQRVHAEKSFWKPYLSTLPELDQMTTPLWFEDEEDVAWLADTDVWFSANGRKEAYVQYWHDGVQFLRQAGIDTEPFTWDLFRWAVTIFTSRSFSSRAIAPVDTKYWAAYKSSNEGRRQTVLLDMSHTKSEDLDFPVLFPIQDIGNHHHDAKVDWDFAAGQFSIITAENIPGGRQVLNNYGPKTNGELLLGYGFCIPENPHDQVVLTLKALPEELLQHVRQVLSGYFDEAGEWSGDKATFGIQRASTNSREKIFEELPPALLELLLYNLRHERSLNFEFVQEPLAYLTSANSHGRRYLPYIARMIVQSLQPKLQKLQTANLPDEPRNQKQKIAKLYRDSQIAILESNVVALKAFTRSLRPQGDLLTTKLERGRGYLLMLEEALGVFVADAPADFEDFMLGIRASTNTTEIPLLRGAGWEEDLWVLLLSALAIVSAQHSGSTFSGWVDALTEEYGAAILGHDASGSATVAPSSSASNDLLSVVRQAAESRPGSLWTSPHWTAALIETWAGKIFRYESMLIMTHDSVEEAEVPRLVMYL